jgi:hypothetical protein
MLCCFTFSCTKTSYPCPAIEPPAEAHLRKKEAIKKEGKGKTKKAKNKYDENGRLIKKSYSHSGIKNR